MGMQKQSQRQAQLQQLKGASMRSLAAEHADAQQAGDSQKRSSRALNKLGLSGTSFKGSRRATSEAHEAQAPHQNGSIAAVASQDTGKPSLLGRLCCRCSVLQLCLPQLQLVLCSHMHKSAAADCFVSKLHVPHCGGCS